MATDYLDAYRPPVTLLQAVNMVLAAIGQVPVASLASSSSNVSAETALNRIGESLRETLEEGWHFNTLPNFIIDPNASGEIVLPDNILKFEQGYFPGGWNMDLVQRGQRVFDRKNATYKINTSVVLHLVENVPFEECPTAHRWYITLRAARRAAAGTLISSTAYQFTKADEDIARLRMEQADGQTARRNLRDNPHIYRMRRR